MSTPINRMVLDLSHHETVQDYHLVRNSGIYGIIYKASQGTSYRDPTYDKSRERAIAAGLLWGSYHFGDSSDVEKQVDNYLNAANPVPNELICLDYEDNSSSQMTLAQARSFITLVESALGREDECVVYSGNTLKEALGNKNDPWWGAHRLWLAQYGPDPKPQKSWPKEWLWQYTDGSIGPEPHHVDGISEGIDCNSFAGTRESLVATWSDGIDAVIPTPEPKEVIILAPPGVKITVKQN